jgi:PAS domain S-box-containing protein
MSIQNYQRVISLLPDAALIISSSGKILATNHRAATLFNNIDTVNSSIFDALDRDTHDQTQIYLRQCARSNQPVVGSIRFESCLHNQTQTAFGAVLEPRSSNNEAVILLRMQSKNLANVKFLTLQKQIIDLNKEISQRLHAERELKNQTKQLEVTLASIGDAVIITDEHTRVTFLNPIAESLTGCRLEQASGKPVTDIFVIVDEHTGLPLDNPAQKAILERTMIASDTSTLLIPKQGERKNIETTSAPITLNAVIAGVIIVFHDVTEKRALERQLLERASRLELMNQRKNQFLTMLAHELRSPVSPISNATQLMKLQAKTATVSEEPLQVIERQVSHLKRLIDDMLEVSRITSGKMKIVKTDVDLVNLIEAVCLDFNPQFIQLGIKCVTELPSSRISIHADADRITQVMHNLFNNSLKFTPKGGTITITLSANEESAILQIKDTGIGLAETALVDLFEPFTQAEQSLERSAGGLGLGLSLVKGIIDLHSGTVSASSDGVNRGTTICLTLPLMNFQTAARVESIEDSSVQLHRILLIEDDHDAANMMRQLLEIMGHEVFWSSTGLDGVEQATSLIPTLIICDIGLPGLDGFGVAQQLRKSPITSSIPLVALTGYGEVEFIDRAKNAGFDHHITKPASLKDIRDALAVTR